MNPAVVLEPQDQIPCDIEIRGFAAVEGLVWCANGNGTISVRDASTAKETFQVTRYDRDPAWCLDSVSTPEDPGAATVWIGYSSGTIRVYSALGSHMNDLSYHQAGVTAMRSHKGVSIFTGDQNATIAQWCVQAQSVQRTFQAHTGPIRVLHLVTHSIFAHPFATEKGTVGSFENKYSLLSGSDDCTVRKWPLLPNKSIKEQSPPSEVKQGLDKTNPSSAQQDVITVGGDVAVLHNGPVRCITTAAGHIWSGGEETAVRITSMEVPHRVVAFSHASLESPPSFLYNPLHTELVFVANIDRTVVLWDAKALTPLYTLSNTKQGYVHSIAVIEEALLQSLTIWTSATDSTLHRWNVSVPTDSAVSQVVENTNGTSSPRGLRASDSEVYNLRNEVLHLRNREAHFHQRITSVQNMIDLVQNQREDMDRRHQLEISRLGKVSSMIPSIERKALDAMASARGMHDGGVVINHLKELLDLLRGKRDGATTVSTRQSHSGGPSHSASTQRGYSATRHQSIKIPSTAPRISVSSILAPLME